MHENVYKKYQVNIIVAAAVRSFIYLTSISSRERV